jgi:hypothetical protein
MPFRVPNPFFLRENLRINSLHEKPAFPIQPFIG